jgi:hypothetical protein
VQKKRGSQLGIRTWCRSQHIYLHEPGRAVALLASTILHESVSALLPHHVRMSNTFPVGARSTCRARVPDFALLMQKCCEGRGHCGVRFATLLSLLYSLFSSAGLVMHICHLLCILSTVLFIGGRRVIMFPFRYITGSYSSRAFPF